MTQTYELGAMTDNGMNINYPRGCGKSITPKPPKLTLVAPHAETEEVIQAAAIRELTKACFVVLQTSVRYHNQKCAGCGAWARPTGGTGTTPGVPDLIVSHELWPIGLWIGIEMKSATGALSPAQRLLRAQGRIFVARSAAEAVGLAQSVHAVITQAADPPELDRDAIEAARHWMAAGKAARKKGA